MRTRFMRRDVLKTVPALALTPAIIGSRSGRATAQESLSGDLAVWAMGVEGEKLPTLAQDFMKEFPDVTVEVSPVPWDQAHQKLLTSIAGGGLPDLSMIGTTWMAELVETGALEQLPDDLAGSSDEFWEAAWDAVTVDESAYGVPWYVDTRVLFFRTDLVQQAGFAQAPRTWDELKQAAVAAKESGIRYGIFLHPRADFLPFIWQAGGTIYEDETWHFDTPEVIEALTWYQGFFKEGLTSTDPQFDVTQAFIRGDVPMFYSGPWSIGLINDQGGAEMEGTWSVALVPKNKTQTSFVGGSDLTVFVDGDNTETAWGFIEYLARPEVQSKWYEVTGDLPAVKSAWETGTLAEDPLLQVFGQQLADAKSPPTVAAWAEVNQILQDNLETVTLGDATPEDAAKAMQEAADAVRM